MSDRLAIKHPQKWVRKQFRELGLRPSGGHGSSFFTAETGHGFRIPPSMSSGTAIRIVADARVALGLSRSIVEEKSTVPVLKKGQLRFSEHAAERWALMKTQAAVSSVELEAALFTPGEVAYSVKRGSWLFITARLKVAVIITDTGYPIVTTVMWSREELFEKHPRPEARA